jgi:aspartyl-tRNA(Asn)/glutamyl-tRNA(Gln) amidotransferase subunit C
VLVQACRFLVYYKFMSTIRPDDVRHIAALARLLLTTTEVDQFSTQLASILAYVEKLNELDTESVEPTNQVTDRVNSVREDLVEAKDEKARSAILEAAPSRVGDGFQVPPVLQR